MHLLLLASLIAQPSQADFAQMARALERRSVERKPLEEGWRPGEVNFFELDGSAEYIRRYASNPPPDDELDREQQITVERPRSRGPLFAAGVVGEIVVVEGSGGIAYNAACPSPNQTQTCTYFNDNAVIDVANAVLPYALDEHDMMVIFTTFAQSGAYYAAYYLPLKNDTTGLGACNPNTGESSGCVFDNSGLQLQGIIYMSSVSSWVEQERMIYGSAKPIDNTSAFVYGGVGHETLHRWGSALRFVHPTEGGAPRKDMLGESLAHWNPAVDAEGSMHYGFDWEDQGDGSFELLAESVRYSDLDLYAMGVLDAGDVRPWFLLQNGQCAELATLMRAMGYSFNGALGGVGQYIPMMPVDALEDMMHMYYPAMGDHVTATGTRLDLTISDVQAAEGPRVPGYGAAPSTFRQVWVLVTGPNERLNQVGAAVAEVETVRQTYERYFAMMTDGRATICSRLSGSCPTPRIEPRGARFDDSKANGNGFVDPDESVDVYPSAGNIGDATAQAVKVTAKALDKQLLVDKAEASVGELPQGEGREAGDAILVYVDKAAECGVPLRLELSYGGGNAAWVKHIVPIYPGLKTISQSTFEDGEDGWTINPGGEDDASGGAFARGTTREHFLGQSAVTPAMQTSANGRNALFTDPVVGERAYEHDVDGGFTSLLSPAMQLGGLKDPHIGYRYWHVSLTSDGSPKQEAENKLLVELSADGKAFKEAVIHVDNTSGWGSALIRVRDHFDSLPGEIYMRVTQFDDGADDIVEAGLDDVTLYDPAGVCEPAGCGCASSVSSGLPLGGLVLGLLVIVARRRRSR